MIEAMRSDFSASFDKYIAQPISNTIIGNILVGNNHKIGYKTADNKIYLADDISIRLGEEISISVKIKEWINIIYPSIEDACRVFGGEIIFVPKKELPNV